jgi:pimeloyl-ACP methyl ester carboxylesterase
MPTYFANNHGLRLEYCLEPQPSNLTALAYIPGVVAEANQIHTIIRPPFGRTVLSMSLRGRGQSDAPEYGYSFYDHAADVKAVLEASTLPQVVLMGWSFGVRLAVYHAAQLPQQVHGLILLDGRVNDFVKPQSWVDTIAAGSPNYRGLLEKLKAESQDIDLEQLLPSLQCPVLIVRAGGEGSGLPLHEAERYKALIPKVQLEQFNDSGHEVWEPDYGRLRGLLEDFLALVT